jgi:glycine cleavage system aminomethyltransferase T
LWEYHQRNGRTIVHADDPDLRNCGLKFGGALFNALVIALISTVLTLVIGCMGDVKVGRLTSGGYSVHFGKSIGMGYDHIWQPQSPPIRQAMRVKPIAAHIYADDRSLCYRIHVPSF